MSRKPPPRPHIKPKERNSSSLGDHRQTGRNLQPPMTALMGDTLRPVTWWKSYLPNYLWLCWHVSTDSYPDVYVASKLLDEILAGLGEDRTGFPEAWEFNGRLSDFESIPTVSRDRLLEHLIAIGAYGAVVPEGWAHSLGMYPDAPGRWMIQPWLDDGLVIDPAIAERQLGEVVAKSIDGRGDTATRAKALLFRQKLMGGKLYFGPDMDLDAIKSYPNQSNELNAKAESMMRAMFLAIEGIEDQPEEWVKTFWRSNWKLYVCRTLQERVGSSDNSGKAAEVRDATEALARRVDYLWEEFVKIASTTDPDLYDPDRFEVLTGVVARVFRLLRIFVIHPPMWTMEHGAPVLRALVESRIVTKWLHHRNDPLLYAKFKSYGVGKLKLYKLHLEEFIDGAGEAGEAMKPYLELVTAYVNRDTMEEFIDIDLGGNFAGSDMRKMADEVELGTDYRLLFAHTSSNVHGEWGALDMNVFEACLNPLHGMHRVIRNDEKRVVGPNFIEDVVSYAEELLEQYKLHMSAS